LRDWRISAGSSSPEVQWVLAKQKKNEQKAMKLESGMVTRQSGTSMFEISLRAFELINLRPE
jgi:hypothetical protein